MPSDKRRALVIGGGFSGLFAAKDLKEKFSVTVVDAKEFFEYTPGILRAYVKPAHFDALTFTLQTVVEHKMGVKFIWGEVKALNENKTAVIKPMFAKEDDIVEFDYCAICAGCNFGPFKKWGESSGSR
jgi:NADH dehydrogenase FAD-containing subunit